MADLLLELFSEEIPARMQKEAQEHLTFALWEGLKKAGFEVKLHSDGGEIFGYSTPRRIAAMVRHLPSKTADVHSERKGPKVDAPEGAIQGFLKSTGLKLEQLEKRDGIYFAKLHQKGRPTAEVLKELIEKILAEFPWPKSMRWGNNDVSWVRPLHSILCLFDGKVVPVKFGPVKAGNFTYGHRFLSPKKIIIKKATDYAKALEKAKVMADRETRKEKILKQAEKKAASTHLTLKKDEGLLEEVTGLVEWPVVLMGSIDDEFMDLPPEVLSTVMKKHQKYFSLTDKNGKLAAHFLTVANVETKDNGKAIIAGNERVLRARFSDARFFWDQDRKRLLSDWADGLKDVTFHAKLGSIADKVSRIEALALQIAQYVPGADRSLVEKAAQLCKADLVTGMVGEFAELQGIMGRYYAKAQGEDFVVADAIHDHYKPQGPNDNVPHTPISICIALADKLDTLVAMFAIGEKPTGSKDPFALRRAALGIIRTILENKVRLPLKPFFVPPTQAIATRKAQAKLMHKLQGDSGHQVGKYLTVNETAQEDLGSAVPANLSQMLYDFFIDRLKVQLKEQGLRHDVINAVVASGDDDLVRIVARAKALQDFLASDDGANLLVAYKRAANILMIEEKKDKLRYQAGSLEPQKLRENEERKLAEILAKLMKPIENLREQEQFGEAMKRLAELRAPVDRFFDKTMVNCDDKELRANRLALLDAIRSGMDAIASFAAIEGDAKEQKKAA